MEPPASMGCGRRELLYLRTIVGVSASTYSIRYSRPCSQSLSSASMRPGMLSRSRTSVTSATRS